MRIRIVTEGALYPQKTQNRPEAGEPRGGC